MAGLAKRKVQFQSLTDQIETSTPAGRFRDGASDVAPFILVGKKTMTSCRRTIIYIREI